MEEKEKDDEGGSEDTEDTPKVGEEEAEEVEKNQEEDAAADEEIPEEQHHRIIEYLMDQLGSEFAHGDTEAEAMQSLLTELVPEDYGASNVSKTLFTTPFLPGLGAMKHQIWGMWWMLKMLTSKDHGRGVLLGDEMGLGKTISGLCTAMLAKSMFKCRYNLLGGGKTSNKDDSHLPPCLQKANSPWLEDAQIKSSLVHPILIIVPAGVQEQWENEVEKKIFDRIKKQWRDWSTEEREKYGFQKRPDWSLIRMRDLKSAATDNWGENL